VGSTTLKYHLRAIDDLHAWLVEQADWVVLGAADEKKPAASGSVEEWGRSPDNQSAVGTAYVAAIAVGSGCISRRFWRLSAWPKSPTNRATTRRERGGRRCTAESSLDPKIDANQYRLR
jgi:hypothetical protein